VARNCGSVDDDLVVRLLNRNSPVGHGHIPVRQVLEALYGEESLRGAAAPADGGNGAAAAAAAAPAPRKKTVNVKLHVVDEHLAVKAKSTLAYASLSAWTPRVRRVRGCNVVPPQRTEGELLAHFHLDHLRGLD
jgi:hypothetical protein